MKIFFILRGFVFVFENNVVQRKVDSYCSSKVRVPSLKEGREAEQNSDEDDKNAWVSKQMPKNFFQASHGLRLTLNPFSSCRTPIFRALGPPRAKSW